MEIEAAAKRRRLEQHGSFTDDALSPSFHMDNLPEEIQPLILSRVSLKEAARTSIVSRSWTKLWTCHPNLCFDGTKDQSTNEDIVKIERAKFIRTVNSILLQHSGIGINKFSIRCSLEKKFSHHLDKWILFASAAKAKVIDINLWSKKKIGGPIKKLYHFRLESLGAQDSPFIESLFLKDVSIKPCSDICGFTKLRRLLLHSVQIIGDLPGFLVNCSSLEELEVIACSGVSDLNIPHQLNKLQHLLIARMCLQMVDVHAPGLAHFEYEGVVIPILLHGCSKLEKATLTFEQDNKVLGHAFTAVPSISAVEVLNMHAEMMELHPIWDSQLHMVTRPTWMFTNLRHLSCEIKIITDGPNRHSGLLQLASYLELAPQLETLQLHMFYYTLSYTSWQGEVTGEGISFTRSLDHLKTVYVSGFRGFRAQVEVLSAIMEKGAAIEHVTIEPQVKLKCPGVMNANILEWKIKEWARRLSQRFGKAITVAPPVEDPLLLLPV